MSDHIEKKLYSKIPLTPEEEQILLARRVFVLFKELPTPGAEEVVGVFQSFEKLTAYVKFLREKARSSCNPGEHRWDYIEYICDELYNLHLDSSFEEDLKKNGFTYDYVNQELQDL